MSQKSEREPGGQWFLEGYGASGGGLLRAPLRPLPFRIGRRAGLGMTLSSGSVSQEHAEIYLDGGLLWVRDLGSTNGTFLNRQRVTGPSLLQEGDILHFADQEFRLIQDELPDELLASGTVQLHFVDLPQRLAGNTRELRRLMAEAAVAPLFQPIVELEGERRSVAFETLCRGRLDTLPTSPEDLLTLAQSVGLEVELSHLFRSISTAAANDLPPGAHLFLNTHPGELYDPARLLGTLEPLAEHCRRPIVLEIHEAAVTDLRVMGELRRALDDLGIGLAYDDFGSGRARLLELVEVLPDYLKFDISLVRNLDLASAGHQRMVATLVVMARELGITPVAEGIERAGEEEAARHAGFTLAQGFFLGRPAPARSWS